MVCCQAVLANWQGTEVCAPMCSQWSRDTVTHETDRRGQNSKPARKHILLHTANPDQQNGKEASF